MFKIISNIFGYFGFYLIPKNEFISLMGKESQPTIITTGHSGINIEIIYLLHCDDHRPHVIDSNEVKFLTNKPINCTGLDAQR